MRLVAGDAENDMATTKNGGVERIHIVLSKDNIRQRGSFRSIKSKDDEGATNEMEKVNIGINGFS